VLEEQLLNLSLSGAAWVLWLLVGLSVLCFTVAIERFVYAALNSTPAGELGAPVKRFLDGGAPEELLTALNGMKGLDARVLAAGVSAGIRNGAEAATDAIHGSMTLEKLKLERGLIVIGTVGSNAPFIGLFGTVLGIIKAFADLANKSDEAMGNVMAGISEALVATAVGLMVAIPAVVLFNWLSRRNKDQLGRVESVGHHVISRFRVAHTAGKA
jgi:biopolymer transport protein ExbB